MIVNDNSSIVNKLETSVIDDARVIIYDRQMFTVQATKSISQIPTQLGGKMRKIV
jgi:acetylglutamate kinase